MNTRSMRWLTLHSVNFSCKYWISNVALIFTIFRLLSGVRHRSWALQRNPVRSSIGREYWWNFLYWQRSPLWHLLPHIEINHSHLRWSQPFSISYHVRYISFFDFFLNCSETEEIRLLLMVGRQSWLAADSPKKRTNEFVFQSLDILRSTQNLKKKIFHLSRFDVTQ